MDEDLPDLGDVQREIMHLVWTLGPATAEQVRAKLKRPLKEATVRTVLRRLEEKGYVAHTTEGRTFIYTAREDRRHVAAKAVRRIADWFCQGSLEDVFVGMVDGEMLDQKELKRLAERIEKARKGKK